MMKKLVLIFLLFGAKQSFSQWTNLNSGTTNWLRGVFFTALDTGYAVGYNGTILKTNDGGLSWNAQSSGTTDKLYSVFFINASTGWICGENRRILKTTNGGQTWTQQTPTGGAILHEIFFVDANNGYVAGESATCLKTTNGGNTWTSMNIGNVNGKVSVFFNNVDTGYICGLGFADAIIKTTDAGSNWSNLYSSSVEEFADIHFTSINDGFVVSDVTGAIYETHNAGASWVAQTPTANGLYAIDFPSANVGFTVGGFPNNSIILRTVNGGASWTPQASPTSEALFDVCFVNTSVGYAVGENGVIVKTTNGSPVGIYDKSEPLNFNIFPNPNNGHFQILNPSKNISTFEIYDLSGKKLMRTENFQSGEEIDLTQFEDGLYFIKFFSRDGAMIATQKIIKTK